MAVDQVRDSSPFDLNDIRGTDTAQTLILSSTETSSTPTNDTPQSKTQWISSHFVPSDEHGNEMREDESKFDILQWWQQHSCLFPGLSRVAKALFAISPTSSPSERAFRAGRDQAPFTRNRLNEETLSMLMECKSW